ncbi:MAG: ATP-binding protein [Chloroflexota bacterium]
MARRYLPLGVIEKLTHSAANAWGERRDVAVLFADLCDYTALSGSFDPELVYGMLNAILDVLVKEIHRFEGVVNQFRGDGLMATFGIPLAHENDPERAVWAALNMQSALRDLNREIESRLGVTVKMRIGINHGEVIAGSIGSQDRKDFTIVGSAVNLAARLETAAEPGSVLVSESVYQRTCRLFEFSARPPLRLKGIAEPVANWLAWGPKEHPTSVRGLEGLSARMIGRDDELRQLQAAADSLLEDGCGRLVLVTGEAGIGKSRLTAEFLALLPNERVTVLKGACQAHTIATAYSLFRSLLESALQLPATGSEERRQAVDAWLLIHLPGRASTMALFLAHLLDLSLTEEDAAALQYLEPSQLQQQVFVAVRDLLRCIAEQQPAVVILEDLHWIDNTSLDLLAFLLPLMEQVPLFFFTISRPLEGLAVPRLKEMGTTRLVDRFTAIELTPLSQNDTRLLLADLLAVPAFSETLHQTILERAGGNPFFLEEFIRMLIDGEYIVLDVQKGRWVAAHDVDWMALRVPQTLQELIITRMDRLPMGPQQVLACASVLGQSLSQDLLAEVVEPEHRPGLASHLAYLVASGFIFSHFETADAYVFRHVVTQEAVYDSLLLERRQLYHRRAAQGLEKLFSGQLDEHVEPLAYHYSRSDVAVKAVPYLTQAASRDARRYANDEALQHFDEALALLPSLPADSQPSLALKIALGRGDIYLLVGRYLEARREYWRGLGVLHSGRAEVFDPAQSLAMKRKMGVCFERQGEYPQAMLWYQLALAEVRSSQSLAQDHRLEVALLYSDVGWLHWLRNELDEAEMWLGDALQLVKDTDHRGEIASIHNRMGGLWFRRGDLARAAQEVTAAVTLYESMGDLQGMARGYANLGVLAERQGHLAEAAGHFMHSLEAHERTGWVQGQTIASCNLGVVYTNLGQLDLAQRYLSQSLQGALVTADNLNAAIAHMNLGRSLLFAEEWPWAKNHLGRALALAQELGDANLVADSLELLGEVAVQSGDLDEAESLAGQALEAAHRSESGREERQARAWRLSGMVGWARGRLDEAQESLSKSRQMFEAQNNPLELSQVLLAQAFLHRDWGHEALAAQLAEECWALSCSLQASLICLRAQSFLQELRQGA